MVVRVVGLELGILRCCVVGGEGGGVGIFCGVWVVVLLFGVFMVWL